MQYLFPQAQSRIQGTTNMIYSSDQELIGSGQAKIVVAKWKFSNFFSLGNTSFLNLIIQLFYMGFTTGDIMTGGQVNYEVELSDDDVSYSSLFLMQINSPEQTKADANGLTTPALTVNPTEDSMYVRIVIYNTDVGEDYKVVRQQFLGVAIPPSNVTIERLV